MTKDFTHPPKGGHAPFACKYSTNKEDILITSFPDGKAWGMKACTSGQGSAEVSQPTIKHLVCAKGGVGPWGSGGNRLDKLPGLLELTLLWEGIRGDTIIQWRSKQY